MKNFYISQDLLNNLLFFKEQPEIVCREFCKVAIDFLLKGEVNSKLFSTAASKLSVRALDVENAIKSLMQILSESSKDNLLENELREVLDQYKISENLSSIIAQSYVESSQQIRENLKLVIPHFLPAYKNVVWRFEINVATRSLRNFCEPMFTLKFFLIQDGKEAVYIFEADAATMIHMTQEIEKAVAQLKSREYRKIAKFIK